MLKNTTLFKQLIVIVLLTFSGSLLAADLTSAKKAGIIGEQANGYIGFVKNAPSDVKALVKNVNQRRKARYIKIARSKKIALSEVTKVGGKKTIEKTKSGNYIKPNGSNWIKK